MRARNRALLSNFLWGLALILATGVVLELSLRALLKEDENRRIYNIEYQQRQDAHNDGRWDMPPPSESSDSWKRIKDTEDWE